MGGAQVRALYGKYDGGLYIVQKNHTQEQMTIGVLEPGGFADKAKHDKFCAKLDCVILSVLDQSPMKNHLTQRHGLVNASRHPIIVGDGVGVYGMWFDPGYGYVRAGLPAAVVPSFFAFFSDSSALSPSSAAVCTV